MKGSRLILTLLGLGIGFQILVIGFAVAAKKTADARSVARTEATFPKNGFVDVAMPEEAEAFQVLVVGPNCNSPEGIRTQELVNQLEAQQIPYQYTNAITLSGDHLFSTEFWRSQQVLSGASPKVFLNGRGKANAQLQEVLSEYQAASRRLKRST